MDTEHDLCVIGAGPVGMQAALSAVSVGLRVLVLERGSLTPYGASFDRSVTSDPPYPDPASTRSSSVGGSSWRWRLLSPSGGFGARLTLEPATLERRVDGIASWGLGMTELTPSVDRVLRSLSTGLRAEDLLPTADAAGSLRISHFGFCRSADIRAMWPTLGRSGSVELRTGVEVISLDVSGRTVGSAMVRNTGTNDALRPVRARQFLIAGAAIDTCRLLFATQQDNPSFERLDGLGRGICDHPRMIGTTELRARLIELMDRAISGDPPRQLRFEPTPSVLADGLPSASVSFVPQTGRDLRRRAGERLAWGVALVDNVGATRTGPKVSAGIANVIQRAYPIVNRTGQRLGIFGFDTDNLARPGSFKDKAATALVMAEQLADERNLLRFERVDRNTSARASIEFGVPFSSEATLRTLSLIGSDMQQQGFATAPNWAPAPTAFSSHHLTGGASISGPSAIADRNGLVHGTDNLAVAGLATFPSAGHANPTLLAMALADRTVRQLCGGGRSDPA